LPETAGPALFFVVTTGRSGSTTIAAALSQHEDITCRHENRPQLVRLSTEYEYGLCEREDARAELAALYGNGIPKGPRLYGESDQKFWNLVEVLAELYPNSKFIWLLRDGRDVVSSAYARGWYGDLQLSKASPTGSLAYQHFFYRVTGDLSNAMPEEEWSGLARFEKVCWYWKYVNERIEKQLSVLPQDRWRLVKLEELQTSVPDLIEFLGVSSREIAVPHSNKAANLPQFGSRADSLVRWPDWGEDWKSAFENWCGELMDRHYPSWR
jgi:hypothetical protein